MEPIKNVKGPGPEVEVLVPVLVSKKILTIEGYSPKIYKGKIYISDQAMDS